MVKIFFDLQSMFFDRSVANILTINEIVIIIVIEVMIIILRIIYLVLYIKVLTRSQIYLLY